MAILGCDITQHIYSGYFYANLSTCEERFFSRQQFFLAEKERLIVLSVAKKISLITQRETLIYIVLDVIHICMFSIFSIAFAPANQHALARRPSKCNATCAYSSGELCSLK